MNTLKRLTTIALTSTALLCGTVQAAPNELMCLNFGKMAAQFASARINDKWSEEAVQAYMKEIGEGKYDETLAQDISNIIQYVYTMQFTPADARKLVYLKCLAGEMKTAGK